MYKEADAALLFSPSDLVKFLGCHHATYLDYFAIQSRSSKTAISADNEQGSAELLKIKGLEHENAYLQKLKTQYTKVLEIPRDKKLQERVALTTQAMRDGADVIYQGVMREGCWRGDADFLIKVNRPSVFGDYSYEVVDTKLSKHAEPKYIIQLCVYSELLEKLQGEGPSTMHLVLGDGRQESFTVNEFRHYYQHARRRFESYVNAMPGESYPEPCQACELCPWLDACTSVWEKDDHLGFVANIQKTHIQKLEEAGIDTLEKLAELPPAQRIPDLNDDVRDRLQQQASLQLYKRNTGKDKVEILALQTGKGFERLPPAHPADLFFDMEGDPLYPDGLEYLFGLYYLTNKDEIFQPFWAHDHEAEKETFSRFMAFLDKHLKKYPEAHIYHYNHYEPTALKRLACRYAVAEEQLDNLLRGQKFVDLYKVVRECLRVSEPAYSIKNMETFYMEKREGAVTNAGDSIVIYNNWRATQEQALLDDIAAYNKTDCISTHKLRDWLLALRPTQCSWFAAANANENEAPERKPWEIEYEEMRAALLASSYATPDLRERIANLLEFHRREAKPQWWAMFERQDKTEDELINDLECIGGLVLMGKPELDKRSLIYSYRFPPQEFKLSEGDAVKNITQGGSAGTIHALDEKNNTLQLRIGNKQEPLPARLSIGPGDPIETKLIRAAIYRAATSFLAGEDKYKAAFSILERALPDIKGLKKGAAIVDGKDLLSSTIHAITNLNNSYIFIQGPPGAGKTYTSAHVICDLLRRGKRIGVTANSHKAIENLLKKIEEVALELNLSFRGAKKGSAEDGYQGRCIRTVVKNDEISLSDQLVAGTAWLFSRDEHDQQFDYLFIDEAGQVSLANVLAMGTAAHNIVLVGDQMQLGQPIQGVHPGDAGHSVLEFLLQEHATIPPERGIFLADTRRLHPQICRFISEAIYDGRLQAHPDNIKRSLKFAEPIDGLATQGIHFVPVHHSGCSQKSEEEGAVVKKLFQKLRQADFIDKDGTTRKVGINDILVVSPYNVQVNYLQPILPPSARVGTVDKFQGQEAPIVLVSMVTSGPEDLPRNIEFLYSKNRLNVAVSRAQCLAVVIANPALLEILCSKVEQMRLVNTFCWLHDYAAK